MQNANFLDNKLVHSVNNHPVHLLDKNGNLHPSAFIPFCDLGGNISVLGKKVTRLDMPVCNAFKEKFHNNQLCYEIDVNNIIRKENATNILHLGLSFIVDTNENRQIQLSILLVCNRFSKLNSSKSKIKTKIHFSPIRSWGKFFPNSRKIFCIR